MILIIMKCFCRIQQDIYKTQEKCIFEEKNIGTISDKMQRIPRILNTPLESTCSKAWEIFKWLYMSIKSDIFVIIHHNARTTSSTGHF